MIEIKSGVRKSPRKLVMMSHQGCGKTSALIALCNHYDGLLIDFEDGVESLGVDSRYFNVKKESMLSGKSEGQVLYELIANIRAESQKLGHPVYKFIAIDTLTAVEKLARVRATTIFKKTLVGQGMEKKGTVITDVVSELPEGGG